MQVRPSAPGKSGPAELMIANLKGIQRLTNVFNGPVGQAKNKSGYNAVAEAMDQAQPLVAAVEAVQVKEGKVEQDKLDLVRSKGEAAATVVGGLCAKLRTNSLEKAQFVTAMKNKAIQFFQKPNPKEWKTPYINKFTGEMVRQLRQQSEGLNQLSLDAWVINVNKYSPTEHLNEMDESAKQAVLDILHARALEALPKAQARLAKLQAKKIELEAELQKAKGAGGDTTAAQEALKKNAESHSEAHGDLAGLSGAVPEIEKGKKGGKVEPKKMKPAGGRDGDEKDWAADHKGGKQAIVKQVLQLGGTIKEWEGIVEKTKDLAVLHDPDQIAGGHGEVPTFPIVEEPTGPDVTADNRAAWLDYLSKVKSKLGVTKINSSLGSQWKTRIDELYSKVITDPENPQAAYGIRKLNLELRPAE